MEILVFLFGACIAVAVFRGFTSSIDTKGTRPNSDHHQRRDDPTRQRDVYGAKPSTLEDGHQPNSHPDPNYPAKIQGRARIVDGDTIVIGSTQIRLFGIDAPEISHPHGNNAKWALVALCKGHLVTADVRARDIHGRTVAQCRLPDGRDLSAEMVRLGMALDWPKFSGGLYTELEQAGVRKKLWLADARQKGRMHVWVQFEARQLANKAKP